MVAVLGCCTCVGGACGWSGRSRPAPCCQAPGRAPGCRRRRAQCGSGLGTLPREYLTNESCCGKIILVGYQWNPKMYELCMYEK